MHKQKALAAGASRSFAHILAEAADIVRVAR
jgi:hypothetical protein